MRGRQARPTAANFRPPPLARSLASSLNLLPLSHSRSRSRSRSPVPSTRPPAAGRLDEAGLAFQTSKGVQPVKTFEEMGLRVRERRRHGERGEGGARARAVA